MLERLHRLALIAALMAAALPFGTRTASSQTLRTATSARQLWGTQPVKVRIEYGAGHLQVQSAEKGTLYRMVNRYEETQVVPVSTYSEESRTLHLGLRSREGQRGKRSIGGSRATSR